MYAAIPLAESFALRNGGFLRDVSFGKFVGTIGVQIHGGFDSVQRDLEEFRLLVDAADDFEIDHFDNQVEIHFIFWDIYEVVDTTSIINAEE